MPRGGLCDVRRAALLDADAVGTLTEQVYRAGGWTSESYAAVLRDGRARIEDAVVFVATLDGAVVGSATLAPPATRFVDVARSDEAEVRMLAVAPEARRRGIAAEVRMLAVAPEARRRGIADALMDACERHARDAGLAGVVLSSDPGMRAAHRLYRRRGYRREPGRDWSTTRTTYLVYRVDLAASGPGTKPGST